MEEVIQEALSKGIEMHLAGEFDLASQLFDSILKLQPEHADANHNMGLLKLDMGQDLDALPYLQAALQADMSIAQFWLSYIKALIKLEKLEDAGRILELAKESGFEGDEFFELSRVLGVSTEHQTVSETKLDTSPPPQETIDLLINLYNQGQLAEVEKQAKALLQQYPEAFIVWNIIGLTAAQTGNLDQAIEAFQKALFLNPTDADTHFNMGNALKDQGKLDQAIRAYSISISLNPETAAPYFNIGNILKDQNRLEEAVLAYSKALIIKPESAEGYNNLGNVLKDQGKLAEATKAYTKAISLKPEYAAAHRNLSIITEYQDDNPQISAVNNMLQNTHLDENDRCHLHYAFAKMQEDIGNLSSAFAHYVAGGELRKRQLLYDFDYDKRRFSVIKETAQKIADFHLDDAFEATRFTPVFILGMPRSGSTLVEQILSCHSMVHGAGELSLLSRFGDPLIHGAQNINLDSILHVRKSYLNELEKVSNGSFFVTDKTPQNFIRMAIIVKALPEAKIIHVKRNSAATCWSNFKHFFFGNGLPYSYNLDDTVSYFKIYEQLMQFWNGIYPGKIYHLNYEKLVDEQEIETKMLIQHLSLQWEEACLSPENNKRIVKTASQLQVRKKLYKGSSDAWRKFEPFLYSYFQRLHSNVNEPIR